MGKFGILLVALALLGTARCYGGDPGAALADVPVVGAIVSPPPKTPAYVAAIGKEAAVSLPDGDMKKWFAADAADPMDAAVWQQVAQFAAAAGTKEGWAQACKKAAQAAGADRASEPLLGALACSADPSVTGVQRFAVDLLAARAAVALWVKGVPGASVDAIGARQGELRVDCAVDAVARQGGAGSPFAQACAAAQDGSYLQGDGPATFAKLGEAYAAVAAEIAKRDPKVAQEPAYWDAAATATAAAKK